MLYCLITDRKEERTRLLKFTETIRELIAAEGPNILKVEDTLFLLVGITTSSTYYTVFHYPEEIPADTLYLLNSINLDTSTFIEKVLDLLVLINSQVTTLLRNHGKPRK